MTWTSRTAALAAALCFSCGGEERPASAETEADAPGARAPGDTAAAPGPFCSAAALDPWLPAQPELPAPVAETRAAIARAAVACDYAGLDSLALAGRPGFTHSLGDGGSPGEHWVRAEGAGENPLAMLVGSLALPWIRQEYGDEPRAVYVWPSAFRDEPTEADWAALKDLYSAEEVQAYREIGFIGWRAGIAEDGDWRFFLAGD